MPVVGLIGSKGAGKDTVADLSCQKFPNTKKVSFARIFKDLIMKNLLNFTDDQLDNPEFKDAKLEKDFVFNRKILRKIVHEVCEIYNKKCIDNKDLLNPYSVAISNWENKTFKADVNTNRDVMRFVSTDIIRKIKPDWHVVCTFMNMDLDKNYIISDMRFKNEYELAKKYFGNDFKLIYVKNERAESKNKDTHVSENEYKLLIPKANSIILNVHNDFDKLNKEIENWVGYAIEGKKPFARKRKAS